MTARSVKTHTFSVWQDGIKVAAVTSDDRIEALREALHYLMQYSQDGKAELRGVTPEDWAALNAPRGWDKAVVQ